ncbi:MAG TPA: amino acid adenylation domain-containing protein [Acidimicrobiales bacterium]|nr:amino acid adenylation domain-containing protein [Acidimicrobiales bacterium]
MPDPSTIPALVEAQARRSPGTVAVVAGTSQITYGELDREADHLAGRLRRLAVEAEVAVGVCLPRVPELAVALLGVLKAGGACLPLDPSYPQSRLSFMLGDACARVLLTTTDLAGRFGDHRAEVVALDRGTARPAGGEAPPAPGGPGPDDLAYLLYTSGSTGTPKGVMLSHGALVNHHRAAIDRYGLAPGDRVLQFCSISFDVSVEELFPTWASGGTVVLRPDDAPLLGRSWSRWLRDQRLSVMNLPTAYWHEWVRDLDERGDELPPDLRLVVVGGDRALGEVYRRWQHLGGRRVRWINAYGPTEASVMATVYEPGDREVTGDPPIGRPLPGVTVHLLDDRGQPVAPGQVGEIHIGGRGLARGYLGRPELTAAAFVDDSFSGAPGARLYRTGDLARQGDDGNLAFVGRRDEQVKIRGFRIECGEVEATLATHPAVSEAVVVARADERGDKRLVAYTVAGAEVAAAAELRRYLAERLPSYMVPATFVDLDAFPLTPNGKLDRQALPPPGRGGSAHGGGGRAPRGGTEEAVAAIWRQVLAVPDLGANDDFFELGGHSLLATQAVARTSEAFGIDLSLHAIFENPTVARLAAVVDQTTAAAGSPGGGAGAGALGPQPRSPGDRLPLSLPQEQMWRLEAQAQPRGLYNVTAQHRFPGAVDREVLARTLDHLARRHEILRTSFAGEDGQPWQRIAGDVEVALAVTDLTSVPTAEREDELARRVGEEDARPFDLEVAPLFRAHAFDLGPAGTEVAVTFDHLVSDGTSAYIFLSELAATYQALLEGRPPELRPLALQYADFALWQRRRLTPALLERQLAYWTATLAGMPLGPAVPFDQVPERPSRRISCRPLTLDRPTYRRLQAQVRAGRASTFVACVAALSAVTGHLGRTTDVVLSTTLSGRNRPELEGVIGFFAGVGRIRTDLSGDPTFAELLARARDRVLGLFDHQDIPFLRVRDALLPDFPTQVSAVELMSVLPIEIQYFHAAHDEWAPGVAVVERPGPDRGPDRLYFRGQLPPLSVTFLDDGAQLWAEVNYKVDFYDDATAEGLAAGIVGALTALADTPGIPVSELDAGS